MSLERIHNSFIKSNRLHISKFLQQTVKYFDTHLHDNGEADTFTEKQHHAPRNNPDSR